MDDLEFKSRVIDDLATIKERLKNVCDDHEEVRRTLFGVDGTSGLAGEVGRLRNGQSWWNRGMLIAQGLLAAGLAALGLQKGP